MALGVFEEVKRLYGPARKIGIYGPVIVVPQDKFELDWDHALSAEGCCLTRLEVDDKPSVLVSAPVEDKPPTETKDKSLRDRMLERKWTDPEDDILLLLLRGVRRHQIQVIQTMEENSVFLFLIHGDKI